MKISFEAITYLLSWFSETRQQIGDDPLRPSSATLIANLPLFIKFEPDGNLARNNFYFQISTDVAYFDCIRYFPTDGASPDTTIRTPHRQQRQTNPDASPSHLTRYRSGYRQFNYGDLLVSSGHCLACHAVGDDATDAACLQFGEDFGEVARFGVYPEHVGGQTVDNVDAAVPEALFGILNEERLQRIRDLVAHVRIGEIEAGEDDGLEVLLALDVVLDEVTNEHVDEDDVGRVDESDILEYNCFRCNTSKNVLRNATLNNRRRCNSFVV